MAIPTARIQSTKSSRSFKTTPIVLDLTNDSGIIDNSVLGLEEKYGNIVSPPSPIRTVTPGKVLRSKRDMSVKRYSAPPVSPLRMRHASMESELPTLSATRPDSPASIESPPLRTTSTGGASFLPTQEQEVAVRDPPPPQVHHRTQSQPTPAVKFGHPSRPYYSGIRPRPTSVIGLSPSFNAAQAKDGAAAMAPAVRTRPSSLSIEPPEAARFTAAPNRRSFLDVRMEDGDIVLPTPSALSPPPSLINGGNAPNALPFGVFMPTGGAMVGMGHSTSGETEMRMAAGDASYTFTERSPSRRGSLIKNRMKGWKHGMKGLFLSLKKP